MHTTSVGIIKIFSEGKEMEEKGPKSPARRNRTKSKLPFLSLKEEIGGSVGRRERTLGAWPLFDSFMISSVSFLFFFVK